VPPRAAVVSLATHAKRYPQALERLGESLERAGFRGQTRLWRPGDFPPDCPSHAEVPFAFKPFCFREAERHGLELVLWLDAACVVVRDLGPLFRSLEARGYLLFRNRPWKLGEWASDAALAAFGVERQEAMRLPEVDAAALGLHLGHPLGREFLDRWLAAARDGVAFRGTRAPLRTPAEHADVKWNRARRISADPRVRGHRHDQTVAGLLAHRLGLRATTAGLATVSQRRRWIAPRTVIVLDRDVSRPDAPLRTVTQIRRDRYVGALASVVGLWRADAAARSVP
jgi:hypothetical protein